MAPRTTWEKVKQEHVSFARALTVQNQDHFGNVHCEQHFDWRSWNTGKEEGLSGCANPLCSMTRRNRAPLWVGTMACLHLQKQFATCQQLLVEDPCGCSLRFRKYHTHWFHANDIFIFHTLSRSHPLLFAWMGESQLSRASKIFQIPASCAGNSNAALLCRTCWFEVISRKMYFM